MPVIKKNNNYEEKTNYSEKKYNYDNKKTSDNKSIVSSNKNNTSEYKSVEEYNDLDFSSEFSADTEIIEVGNGNVTIKNAKGDLIIIPIENFKNFLKSMYVSEADIGKLLSSELTIKEVYINSLLNRGFLEKDIDRLIKNEITMDKLIKEIQKDEDTSRMKKILSAQYINNIKYSYQTALSSKEMSEDSLNINNFLASLFNTINSIDDLSLILNQSKEELNKLKQERKVITNKINSIKSKGEISSGGALIGLTNNEIEQIKELTNQLHEYDKKMKLELMN